MGTTKKRKPLKRSLQRPLSHCVTPSNGSKYVKNSQKVPGKEERRHPDSPDGLVVAASKNRAFAERFVGMSRLALIQAGVKHGRR